MKKEIFSMIALLLSAVLLLSSCIMFKPSVKDDDDPPLTREDRTESTAAPLPEGAMPDFSSIMAGSGKTDTVWGMSDPAAKQRIIDSAKAEGFDVSFGDDGSMTVKDKDGTVFVQSPDGAWSMKEDGGQSASIGGEWPDNKFTKLIPKPDFKHYAAAVSSGEFTAAFMSVKTEQIRSYAGKIKAAGFTVDAEEEDQNVYGVEVYSYSAYNADGYRVEISFASGSGSITVSK